MFSPSTIFFKFFFAHENMKKPASKVAKPAQIQPKSQFMFHKNLPPRDFSIMTLIIWSLAEEKLCILWEIVENSLYVQQFFIRWIH